MAGENVETVRRMFDAFNRGDHAAAFADVHEDIEWGEPPDMPDTGGTYRGHEGMVKGFTRFLGAWEPGFRVDLEELFERGEGVVAMTRWAGKSRTTGIAAEQRIAQLYEFRDGKVARLRQFRELDEALAAADA